MRGWPVDASRRVQCIVLVVFVSLTLVVWAGRALAAVRASYAARGQAVLFEQLAGFLTGAEERRQAEVAQALGLADGAMRVAIHRVRELDATVKRAGFIESEFTPTARPAVPPVRQAQPTEEESP